MESLPEPLTDRNMLVGVVSPDDQDDRMRAHEAVGQRSEGKAAGRADENRHEDHQGQDFQYPGETIVRPDPGDSQRSGHDEKQRHRLSITRRDQGNTPSSRDRTPTLRTTGRKRDSSGSPTGSPTRAGCRFRFLRFAPAARRRIAATPEAAKWS